MNCPTRNATCSITTEQRFSQVDGQTYRARVCPECGAAWETAEIVTRIKRQPRQATFDELWEQSQPALQGTSGTEQDGQLDIIIENDVALAAGMQFEIDRGYVRDGTP